MILESGLYDTRERRGKNEQFLNSLTLPDWIRFPVVLRRRFAYNGGKNSQSAALTEPRDGRKRALPMIFYFSGTGNSAWAARQLARLTDDTACDITQLNELPDLTGARQIGFVFPIYAWGVPEIMADFAKKLPKTRAFTFGVCTCGEDAGQAMKRFSRLYPLSSSYSLRMPNNYIIGSDTDGEDEIRQTIAAAREELGGMAQEIRRQEKVYRVREGTMAGLKSGLVNFGFNRFARSAKPFFAGDRCNGCGLCAANCPAHAITLREGKPVWAAQCCQCLRCINQCPRQAIQYGKATAGRRRYTIRGYLPQDEL